MRYVIPELVAFGSIADHTFTNAGGCGPKQGSSEVRCRDAFCEYSHTTGVDQCGDDPSKCTGPNPDASTCP
jgi:hypothetical protein